MGKQAATWTVWRIDDNANTFVVRSGLSKDEADRVAAEFASHGHKQTYWVEPDEMPRDHDHNPDPNANAARIVSESMMPSKRPPDGLEAAWAEWSSHIQAVDERGMTLLKAAFEAGWEAGKANR